MSLRFIVARSVEHAETPAALERFAAQLGHEIGETVEVELVPSYTALREALQQGRAQLAWVPPVMLADGAAALGLVPLATAVRDGSSEYCSVLFVRAESALWELSDLRGRIVAWVDRCSAAGYLLPQLHLATEGFNPKTLFAREQFAGSHGDVVRAVFEGSADVGATFGGVSDDGVERSGFADVDPKRPVRVVFRSAAVPADAVVCDATLSSATRQRVVAALQHLGTFAVGRRVTRRLFGADGFTPFNPASLERLRRLVVGARDRGWLPPI